MSIIYGTSGCGMKSRCRGREIDQSQDLRSVQAGRNGGRISKPKQIVKNSFNNNIDFIADSYHLMDHCYASVSLFCGQTKTQSNDENVLNKNVDGCEVQTESTKLIISNLDVGVSESDIKDLFAQFGQLESAKLHCDKSGHFLGIADVTFLKKYDAMKALEQCHGVTLKNLMMNIQIATSDISSEPIVNLRGEIKEKNNEEM